VTHHKKRQLTNFEEKTCAIGASCGGYVWEKKEETHVQ